MRVLSCGSRPLDWRCKGLVCGFGEWWGSIGLRVAPAARCGNGLFLAWMGCGLVIAGEGAQRVAEEAAVVLTARNQLGKGAAWAGGPNLYVWGDRSWYIDNPGEIPFFGLRSMDLPVFLIKLPYPCCCHSNFAFVSFNFFHSIVSILQRVGTLLRVSFEYILLGYVWFQQYFVSKYCPLTAVDRKHMLSSTHGSHYMPQDGGFLEFQVCIFNGSLILLIFFEASFSTPNLVLWLSTKILIYSIMEKLRMMSYQGDSECSNGSSGGIGSVSDILLILGRDFGLNNKQFLQDKPKGFRDLEEKCLEDSLQRSISS
ncbi:hypothetical protein Tco_0278715 [Tanacetum coccineum]